MQALKYRLADLVWDALAVFCDLTVAGRVTNWPKGWAHTYCMAWTTFCNRHQLWRP